MLSEYDIKRIKQADILNFGSGPSAYAFDYEAAGINGVNLAMTPSSFALETAFLKDYETAFKKGCAAVFTICPFSFGENRANANPARFIRYFPVLSRERIENLPASVPGWSDEVYEKAQFEHPLFPYGQELHREEVPTEEVMDERIRAMCECWKGELSLKDFRDASQTEAHRKAFASKRVLFDEEMALARALGLRPFLMLPPLHPKLRAMMSPELFDEFVTKRIENCGVPILDYTADPEITADMFMGPVFLNQKGSVYLTRSVWKKVRE